MSFSFKNLHSLLKFLFLEGQSAAKAHQKLMKTLGKKALDESTIRKWYKRFRYWIVEEQRLGDEMSRFEVRECVARIEEASLRA